LLAANLYQESAIEFLSLELALLGIIDQAKNKGVKAGGGNVATAKSSVKDVKKKLIESVEVVVAETIEAKTEISEVSELSWQKLLQFVDQENFSLSALLKSCQLEGVVGGTAKVLVFYDFHKEQLEQVKYQTALWVIIVNNYFQKISSFDFCIIRTSSAKQ